MKNDISQSLGLDLVNITVYAKVYQNIPRQGTVARSEASSLGMQASGPELDPHVRHILSWRLRHENISTAILPLPLVQEEQLSFTGERMCTKYW